MIFPCLGIVQHFTGARAHNLQVCALWHAEMWLRGGGGCVVVEGLPQMTNRFTVPCVVCGRMVRSEGRIYVALIRN